jgi:hypothetical protein
LEAVPVLGRQMDGELLDSTPFLAGERKTMGVESGYLWHVLELFPILLLTKSSCIAHFRVKFLGPLVPLVQIQSFRTRVQSRQETFVVYT